MSAGSSLPYRLRPNKAVDRELFLSLLMRLAPKLALEKYHYVGLGGPFLEDFRLVHGRLGIAKMTCIETEEQVHKRQVFNRPIASIECVHKTLEDYLDETDFETPAIIWFDYTEPKGITTQIERFARTIGTVPLGSVLRVTLNANPTSLGKPDPKDLSVEVEGEASEDRGVKPTIQEWRLARFKERLASLCPSGRHPRRHEFQEVRTEPPARAEAGRRERGAELPRTAAHRVGARHALRRWPGDGHRRVGGRPEGRHGHRGTREGLGVLRDDRRRRTASTSRRSRRWSG